MPAAHPLLALSRLDTSLLITNLQSAVEDMRSPEVQPPHPESLQGVSRTPGEVQEALDEAIRAATRSWTGLSQLLPEGHPVRGVALAELGKLLCVDEPYPKDLEAQDGAGRPLSATPLPSLVAAIQSPKSLYPPSGPARLKLAYETLMCARSELMVGFGGGNNEGGELGKTVRGMMVDVEKELSIWKEGIRNTIKDSKLARKAN